MDIDRGIIKALFYDYPVDAIVKQLGKLNNMEYDDFLDIMPQLLQWSKQEYTYTEANLLRIQTGGEWSEDYETYKSTMYHVFDILKSVTSRLLTIENNKPLVRFEQLFRWKETALCVGEDMLVTSYLAIVDNKKHNYTRNDFLWSDILKHNNHILNEELANGLADVHAHYNATVDVFSLNWINLMNDVKKCKHFDKNIHRSMELELMPPQVTSPSNIRQHSIAAAYIRFVLFQKIIENINYEGKEVIETDFETKVISILEDINEANAFMDKLQACIKATKPNSLKTVDNTYWDYCLQVDDDLVQDMSADDVDKTLAQSSANIIYQGERFLLYTFFKGYFKRDPKCVNIAPYVYLYLVLKNKIRREFVQINVLKGFENFQTYQSRKSTLLGGLPLYKYYPYCVLYTSVNDIEKDTIELRIAPWDKIKKNANFHKPPFEVIPNVTEIKNINVIEPSLVLHFIKQGRYDYAMPTKIKEIGKIKEGTRAKEYRDTIRKQLSNIIDDKSQHNLIGVDAASSEIFCRPEAFAHIFRCAQQEGIEGRTYHVGEDFLDIVDGLRAIDEAILFLQLDDKSRIGHAMALGIDAKAYYERRHYTTIITKQYLLDDCVWLYMRSKELKVQIDPKIEISLLEKANQLYNDIGYKSVEEWNIQTYWHSMLLRGNDLTQYKDSTLQSWEDTKELHVRRTDAASSDCKAKELYKVYWEDNGVRDNGTKLIQYKWKPEIVEIITNMQRQMQRLVAAKRISIECCPTSNLKIGFIDRYEQHPLLTRFYPIDADASYPLIKCSINTDDRGVFYTSIYEEYSLIALALYKMKDEKTGEPKYNEREIIRYIGEIRKNAQLMAFRNYTDNK